MPRPLRNLILAIANRRRRARGGSRFGRGTYAQAVAPAQDAATIEELAPEEIAAAQAELQAMDTGGVAKQDTQTGPVRTGDEMDAELGQQPPQPAWQDRFGRPPQMTPEAMRDAAPSPMQEPQSQQQPQARWGMELGKDYGLGPAIRPHQVLTLRGGGRTGGYNPWGAVNVNPDGSQAWIRSRGMQFETEQAEAAAMQLDAQMSARVQDLTGKSKRFDPVAMHRWRQFTVDQGKVEMWAKDFRATNAELFDIKHQLFRRYVEGFDWDSHVQPPGSMPGDMVPDEGTGGAMMKMRTSDPKKPWELFVAPNMQDPEKYQQFVEKLTVPVTYGGQVIGYEFFNPARGQWDHRPVSGSGSGGDPWKAAQAFMDTEAAFVEAFRAKNADRDPTPLERKMGLARELGPQLVQTNPERFRVDEDDIQQSRVQWGQWLQQEVQRRSDEAAKSETGASTFNPAWIPQDIRSDPLMLAAWNHAQQFIPEPKAIASLFGQQPNQRSMEPPVAGPAGPAMQPQSQPMAPPQITPMPRPGGPVQGPPATGLVGGAPVTVAPQQTPPASQPVAGPAMPPQQPAGQAGVGSQPAPPPQQRSAAEKTMTLNPRRSPWEKTFSERGYRSVPMISDPGTGQMIPVLKSQREVELLPPGTKFVIMDDPQRSVRQKPFPKPSNYPPLPAGMGVH